MNRSSRREEAPINFGFRISDFEKRASYSEKGIGGNARPHPGPLPQERGKHAQFPEFSRPLVWNCFMGTHVGCYEVQGEATAAARGAYCAHWIGKLRREHGPKTAEDSPSPQRLGPG